MKRIGFMIREAGKVSRRIWSGVWSQRLLCLAALFRSWQGSEDSYSTSAIALMKSNIFMICSPLSWDNLWFVFALGSVP